MNRRSAWRDTWRGYQRPLSVFLRGAGHAALACSSITNILNCEFSTHDLPRAMTTLARTALLSRPVASMPPRSIANATISFGLVSVPVNLYSSAESKTSVSFNMLHKKCGGRLKQQYICPKDNNEVVLREETVKGYEFAKDQYVILSAE